MRSDDFGRAGINQLIGEDNNRRGRPTARVGVRKLRLPLMLQVLPLSSSLWHDGVKLMYDVGCKNTI